MKAHPMPHSGFIYITGERGPLNSAHYMTFKDFMAHVKEAITYYNLNHSLSSLIIGGPGIVASIYRSNFKERIWLWLCGFRVMQKMRVNGYKTRLYFKKLKPKDWA